MAFHWRQWRIWKYSFLEIGWVEQNTIIKFWIIYCKPITCSLTDEKPAGALLPSTPHPTKLFPALQPHISDPFTLRSLLLKNNAYITSPISVVPFFFLMHWSPSFLPFALSSPYCFFPMSQPSVSLPFLFIMDFLLYSTTSLRALYSLPANSVPSFAF